jgi:putative ATPase
MLSLLDTKSERKPLAEAIRPKDFEHVYGQEHLLAPNSQITHMLNSKHITNMIFWGPPGSGKTTMARILAEKSGYHFESISAVVSGTAHFKEIFEKALRRKEQGIDTLLLVDEIHHLNRSQQDIFLPHLENGTITLIGATTENPSFELNGALLSRCKILIVNRLSNSALEKIIARAEEISGKQLLLSAEIKEMLCQMADGDGRYLLNMCEELFRLESQQNLTPEELLTFVQKRVPLYDKSQDGHYNPISALHKSLRGSDCNASLYWAMRMLDAGENPLYILRRLVRFATEDIGLADPSALTQAIAAKDAYEFLGSPEGDLAITQLVLYLANAPKSNATYLAHKSALKEAKQHGSLMPPKHILNSPTSMMKEQGYSQGYIYDHDTSDGFSGQDYFPEEMKRKTFYNPVDRGFEREIKKRLVYWDSLRAKKKQG